jgi:hypothetical protein
VALKWPFPYRILPPARDNCPQPNEAQPLSQLEIRIIRHFDSSALMFRRWRLTGYFPILYYPLLERSLRGHSTSCLLIVLVQGRHWLHRLGARSVVVGDVPWVAQAVEQFASKLFARGYSISSIYVWSANPADQLVRIERERDASVSNSHGLTPYLSSKITPN